jgi:hypothetical protein
MKAAGRTTVEDDGWTAGLGKERNLARRPDYMHLVSTHELQSLGDALARKCMPPDFEAKLRHLAMGDLVRCFIEQNCRTMLALLEARHEGTYEGASPADCARLLQVLAYVRKEDDAIPDYRPNGFRDDQQEMRAVLNELGPLLQDFKQWRLQHQVPRMWIQGKLLVPCRT